MTIWILLTIIFFIALIPFLIWKVIDKWNAAPLIGVFLCVFGLIVFGFIAGLQIFDVRSTMHRQSKERQQILHQIEHLDEKSDKVKLNEWILTYNDWVNDVNTSKELYGWFSWYAGADMSEHIIIELV